MAAVSYLDSLNGPQRRAVTYGEPIGERGGFRSGPLLVVAGAGTGKTNTIAHRVAHLVLNGVDPAPLAAAYLHASRGARDAPPRA